MRAEHHPPRRRRDRTGVPGCPRTPAAHSPRRLPPRSGGSARLRPHRLPAVARPSHDQRVRRCARAAHPDPVRVLRPRGPQPASRHRADDPEAPEPSAAPLDHPADHVRRAHAPRTAGGRGGAHALSRRRCSRPSFRGLCVSRRRRASARRSSPTMGTRPERSRIAKRRSKSSSGTPVPRSRGTSDGQANRPGAGDRRADPDQ